MKYNLKKKYKRDKIKICLCSIGKKENLYVKEFVYHYQKLGYDHIFLYDNNDINEEYFNETILKEINDKFVSIINYRGFRGKSERPQFDAYYDCYKRNGRYYDWLSFFDLDEFLILIPKNIKIQNFLGNKRFDKCKNIKINWLIYNDNNKLYYENKSLEKRFTSPNLNDSANFVIKSTIKGKISKNCWEKTNNPHSPNKNIMTCSPSGKIINSKSFYNYPPDFKYAYLKHYATKTIEEYCIKIKKGRADTLLKFNNETLKQRFIYFFNRNKKTKEKLDYIKKIFNFEVK